MEQNSSLPRRQFGTAMLSAASAFSTALFGDDSPQDSVTKWIRERALPLDGVSPDLPLRDLLPLKRVLAGVQVVSVGEGNHGTSEYQMFKHRLFRFLVEEMGFTAFALECSYSSGRAIDEYVINGTGRLEDVLTGQGYTVWDTLEMTALLAWMRKYNLLVNAGKKLRFFGLDISYNERSRKNVLAWLRRHAPDRVSSAEMLLSAIAEEDDKWPGRTDHARVKSMLPDTQALTAFMRDTGRKLPPAINPMDDAVWDMTVIEQWVISNGGGVDRAEWMGRNLNRLLDCYPGMKMLTSAANAHIGHTPGTIGGLARDKLGRAHYSLAAEFGSGSFRIRKKDPDNFFGKYEVVTLAQNPQGSIPWYLVRSGKGSMVLDFRQPSSRTVVADWIGKPQLMHKIPWSPVDDKFYLPVPVAESYDGIYYIDKIRPTRATENGEASARSRSRF